MHVLRYLALLTLMLLFRPSAFSQCGGLDILIANDQSGSVDARENQQSRVFITALAQALPLGYEPNGYRIAIADWDYSLGWRQFEFPDAGKNYTTRFSDIVAYANAPRVLSGGTDLVLALQKSYQTIQADADKSRPKVILLMTDAQPSNLMTQPGLEDLAEQIKSNGIYIAVMAIESAKYYPSLPLVASAGGFFTADTYDALAADASAYTKSIADAACKGNQPQFDLSIGLTSFEASGCFPGPGTYVLNYTIENAGKKAWDDDITVSLYDNSPDQYATKPVAVFKTGKVHIEPGDTYTGSFSSQVLAACQLLNAVVNFNGITTPVVMPTYPFQIRSLLVVDGEKTTANNFSNPINRSNGAGCIPQASVVVDVQADAIGCGSTTGYTVNVCNTGNLDTRITDLTPVADPRFALLYTTPVDSTKTAYYNTYFGGAAADYAYGAATDKFGSIYITGQTNSTNNIATPGAYRTNPGSSQDAFLAKFNAAGTRIWATYLGGPGPENGYSVATDNEGNVYIAGETSNSPNIATGTGWQLSNGGGYDAYLAKFNANGTLLWSTYYGGTGADYGRSVITDSQGNVYLAGNTASTNAIATTGAHQSALGGGTDAFLVKFNKDGVRQWATYYGGTGTESGFGLAVDTHDNIYLTGLTGSTGNIATSGIFQSTKDAGNDAYLVKFNSNGVRQWGTYFGGNNSDNSTSVTVDLEDNVYISGNTSSTNQIASTGCHQAVNNGNTDAFLAKFNSNGARLWSTYYGGEGTDNGRHVHTDNNGFVYLSGSTASTTAIATADGIQPVYGGNTDAYVIKFSKNGERRWGTYFGGDQTDIASATVTDARGLVYMTGATQSLQLATPNSFQYQYGGGSNDAFFMKIDEQSSLLLRAGKCITLHYYYDVSAASAGVYDFSYHLSTDKLQSTDPDANILPDNIGFAGNLHTSDDVNVLHNSPACTTGDKLSIQVNMPSGTTCGTAGFVTATIVLSNTSGININNAVLQLNLQGTDAFFSSELYGLPGALIISKPDISQPAYPAVKYALLQKNGIVNIPVYQVPPGTSTLKVDIATGTASLSLTTQVTGVPIFFNVSGQSNTAVSQAILTPAALPVINGWSPPASINTGETVVLQNIITTNAQNLQWVSATSGNLTNTGTMEHPALSYVPNTTDIANGYVMLSLTILNAMGCDASQTAYIPIKGIQYDYGDAPPEYDMAKTKVPFPAASTLLTGLYLGNRNPSSEEEAKHSDDALGDGPEEDGLIQKCFALPVSGKNYIIKTGVTNHTASKAWLYAFIDWNADGDYLDEGEAALQLQEIPAAPGFSVHDITFTVPATVNLSTGKYFLRLRLSTDTQAVKRSYGPAAGGETEDHLFYTSEVPITLQQLDICKGNAVTVGIHTYTISGNYYDTLINVNGCDSIVQTLLSVKDCGESECGPFVPNAFTPNNDGNNDLFRVILRCQVTDFNIAIYNRWGEKIFESNDPLASWDGRRQGVQQPSGTFIWQCRYKRNGVQYTRKGVLTLIR